MKYKVYFTYKVHGFSIVEANSTSEAEEQLKKICKQGNEMIPYHDEWDMNVIPVDNANREGNRDDRNEKV